MTQRHAEQSVATPPNPQDFDLYDGEEMQAFQRATQAYIEQVVRDQVEAAMGPHSKNVRDVRLGAEYSALARQHGHDKDFNRVMAEALDKVAQSGGELGIIEAYNAASGSSTSRRKNEHLPEKFRDRKKGVGALGKLMQFHQDRT